MATSTTTKNKKAKAETIPTTVEVARARVLSSVRHGQDVVVAKTEDVAKKVSALSFPKLEASKGVLGIEKLAAPARFTRDFAVDLIAAQREFAGRMVDAIKA